MSDLLVSRESPRARITNLIRKERKLQESTSSNRYKLQQNVLKLGETDCSANNYGGNRQRRERDGRYQK